MIPKALVMPGLFLFLLSINLLLKRKLVQENPVLFIFIKI